MARGRGQGKRAHTKCGDGLANPGGRRAQRNAVVREDGMSELSRRDILSTAAAAGAVIAATAAQSAESPLEPSRAPGVGGTDPVPGDAVREIQNPDLINPPSTDSGTLPNLRFSFADAHVRQSSGGWTRQVTARELGVSKSIAGVNMRLNAGGIRELHWHKQAEWAYMLYGTARITAIDARGRNFVDDVGVGDLWYFAGGIPHSIQGLGTDGCEFLLVFDDGDFDEDDTFLLSDWFKHVPAEVLGKNFGLPPTLFGHTPDPRELYIFKAEVPGPLGPDKLLGAEPVQPSFSHRMLAQEPIRTKSGTVRITDSSVFPASRNIAAALVEVDPGGLRELHWHPNTDEWQYYLSGQARMGVFAANGQARTFDYQGGDVGYVPFAMGHYVENTGAATLRFLEVFKSSYYADLSLDQWLALTPPALLKAHLNLGDEFASALRKTKVPIVPA